jgi:hypothetical protein
MQPSQYESSKLTPTLYQKLKNLFPDYEIPTQNQAPANSHYDPFTATLPLWEGLTGGAWEPSDNRHCEIRVVSLAAARMFRLYLHPLGCHVSGWDRGKGEH